MGRAAPCSRRARTETIDRFHGWLRSKRDVAKTIVPPQNVGSNVVSLRLRNHVLEFAINTSIAS